MVQKLSAIVLAVLICTLTAAAEKQKGITNLKDVQPAGITDKKNKNQQFDFTFDAAGMHYTCRSSHSKSVKATDFVVGSDVNYEIKGHKGKLKNTAGKQVECTVVRVERTSTSQK
jgi:hypothetical protein